jgi:hypothetical protein
MKRQILQKTNGIRNITPATGIKNLTWELAPPHTVLTNNLGSGTSPKMAYT